MKRRALLFLGIAIGVAGLLAGFWLLLQKNFETSDAYRAVAAYMTSGEIEGTYGALEKRGWFTYGKIFTEGTSDDLHGTAAFEYLAVNGSGEKYFVGIRLTLENRKWVVTACEITALPS